MDSQSKPETGTDPAVRSDVAENAGADANDSQFQSPPAGHPQSSEKPAEVGGPRGPEPTRYGDWELKGRCIDF
ncbi:MAG: succinate dehydrogenase assembly factor 4 [Pseudomonadota bacterium]